LPAGGGGGGGMGGLRFWLMNPPKLCGWR